MMRYKCKYSRQTGSPVTRCRDIGNGRDRELVIFEEVKSPSS
jgi:hypothetical protein